MGRFAQNLMKIIIKINSKLGYFLFAKMAGLYCELEDAGFVVFRQEEFPIYYKGRPSPVKRKIDLVAKDPDLGLVILELKAINYIGEQQRKQLWSYLKLTNTKYGMLINFGTTRVYSENWELDENTGLCKRV